MKIMNTFTFLLAAGAFIFSLLNWLHKPGSSLAPESSGMNKDLIIAEYLAQKKAEASKFFQDSIVSEQIKDPAVAKEYKKYFQDKYNTPDAGGNQVFFSSVAMDGKFFDAFNTLFEPKGFRTYLMAYTDDIIKDGKVVHKKGDVSIFMAPIKKDGKIDETRIYNYGDPCKPPCPDDEF
jgi:hypothetical protein